MTKYIVRRLLLLIPILLAVSFIVFSLLYITPGDPAQMMLGENATPEAVIAMRQKLGLDQPFFTQYFHYVEKMIQLDIGTSYITKTPVAAEILNCIPRTLWLAFVSICVAVIIGIPIGVISATKQYTTFDNATMVFGLVGISMPVFWLGLLLILLFRFSSSGFPLRGLPPGSK